MKLENIQILCGICVIGMGVKGDVQAEISSNGSVKCIVKGGLEGKGIPFGITCINDARVFLGMPNWYPKEGEDVLAFLAKNVEETWLKNSPFEQWEVVWRTSGRIQLRHKYSRKVTLTADIV